MAGIRRAFPWLIAVACALSGLALATAFFLPGILNRPAVKSRIQAAFAEKLGIEIDYGRVELSFLKLRIIVLDGRLAVRGETRVKFKAVEIYPRLIPLISGDIEFSRIGIASAEMKITLPEGTDGKETEFRTLFPSLGALAASKTSDFSLQIDGARFELVKGDRLLISITDLNGGIQIEERELIYRLDCSSTFWKRLTGRGSIDKKTTAVNGEIRVQQFRLQPAYRQLFPENLLQFGDSTVDFELEYGIDGPNELRADLKGEFSSISLFRGGEQAVMKGNSLRVGYRIHGSKTEVSVSSLDLDLPKIRMDGNLALDAGASDARLEIRGNEADIASIREILLFLFPDEKDVKQIFSILKSGTAPEASFKAQASTLHELHKLKNIVIAGRLSGGSLSIPHLELELADVNGKALILNGTLKGEELSARLGASLGRNGTIELDLENNQGPLSLDIQVDADLAQLPPVLDRLIQNDAFRRELKRIENIKGHGAGRLRLKGSRAAVRPEIEISEFEVHGGYRPFPFPLALRGKRFHLDDNRIDAGVFEVASSVAELSGISGQIDWGKKPHLSIKLGESRVHVERLFPWLVSWNRIKQKLTGLSSPKGVIFLTAAELAGDFLRPESMQFFLSGGAESLSAVVRGAGGPVRLDSGRFTASRKFITLSEMDLSFLDAALKVSGEVKGGFDRFSQATVQFGGAIGEKAVGWASERLKLPPEITLQPPIRVSSARFTVDHQKIFSFSGKLAVEKGPGLDLLVSNTEGRLRIESLRIKDEVSDAELKFQMKKQVCDLSFTGRLEKSTLASLLSRNEFVTGWVAGDLKASIDLNRPIGSTAVGRLEGEGVHLFFPVFPAAPLVLKRFSVQALGNRIRIDHARMLWADQNAGVHGEILFSKDSVELDLTVQTGSLDLTRITALASGRKSVIGGGGPEPAGYSLQGAIRLQADDLHYAGYTWRPFLADLKLNSGGMTADIQEANLCGIAMPASVSISPQGLQAEIETHAEDASLEDSIYCLNRKDWSIRGRYKLDGAVTIDRPAGAAGQDFIKGARGSWRLESDGGHINRATVLAKVFQVLNVAQVIQMKLPDLKTEGFDYDKIEVDLRLEGEKIRLEEGRLSSPSMEVAFKGTLDSTDNQLDLLVIVAPLQTLNLIVKRIPIVRDILEGTFISIPFRVYGNRNDPSVIPMNPKDVGSEMLAMMKRILKAPFELIQPLNDPTPGGETQGRKEE